MILPGRLRSGFQLLALTYRHWRQDNCSLLAAGLAFYASISLVPLLALGLTLAGSLLGPAASMDRLAPALQAFVGPRVALTLEAAVERASETPGHGRAIASLLLLFILATVIFRQLRRVLDMIWKTRPRSGVKGHLIHGGGALLMVMSVGVLILLFAIVNAALGAARQFIDPWAPVLGRLQVWRAAYFAVFVGLTAVMCGAVYRFLPALRLGWRDVWTGAAFTAGLMSVGVYVLGVYFGRVKFWAGFGPATSVMVVLIWVYLSAQMFLFGAEFTWAWAHRGRLLPGVLRT